MRNSRNQLALVVGLMAVIGHEIVYRHTGGDDFPVAVLSHAGMDMLLVLFIVGVVLLFPGSLGDRED